MRERRSRRRDSPGAMLPRRRDDVRRARVNRPPAFAREGELFHRVEVHVERARLVEVQRVRRVHGSEEQVVEDRAVPLEVRAQRPRRGVLLVEHGDVRRGAGEHAARRAVGALRGHGAEARRVSGPVRRWRRDAHAQELLHGGREPCVVERGADGLRVRRALEQADAAADHRARPANRALERGYLRRRPVRPRESDARARVDLVRHVVVAKAERLLDGRIELRCVGEAISVQPHAVLNLEIVGRPVRVPQRRAEDVLSVAPRAGRELARERRRQAIREVGERIEA